MKIDHEGRLILSCLGTYRDLEENGIVLEQGMELTFYNEDDDEDGNRDDLIVQGIVEFDQDHKRWVARVDLDSIKNTSGLSQGDIVG